MATSSSSSASASDQAKAEEYIGSLISLITKSEIRYHGFMFHLDAKEATIGLRNVKSFGTEGRRKDGPQVSPSEGIYEYILFRGSDIKDLQVLSASPVQSAPAVSDDPAIVKPNQHQPASATMSPCNLQGTNPSSNVHLGHHAPSFQGNLPEQPSVGVPGTWTTFVPVAPVNISGPAIPNYWPGYIGLPGGNTHFQQPFPPLPQNLTLVSSVQQPLQHTSMTASFAGNALTSTSLHHPLPPPVVTGSLNLIFSISPPSTVQSPHIPLTSLFSNSSSNAVPNNASGAHPTPMVDSTSQTVPLLAITSSVIPVQTPITDRAQSLLGPAPFPIIPKPGSSTLHVSSTSRSKAPVISPPPTPGSTLQPGLMESSSPPHLVVKDDDAKISLTSMPNPQPSASENAKEPAGELQTPPIIKLHEAASSTHYGNRRNIQGRGYEMQREMYQTYQSNRGHAQGRGRGNLPNRAAMHRNQSYQIYRGYSFGRGNGPIGAPLYPRHVSGGFGREYGPGSVTRYPRRYTGRDGREGGSQVSQTVTRFTEDFDFEEMNKKFNKEEIWGLLGKSSQAEAEDKLGDKKEDDGSDAPDEAGDGSPKLDQTPVCSKDDFFDSISCNALDAESGKGKIKLSERKKIDAETFGEVLEHQRNYGIPHPYRAESSQGSYRGRGYDNSRRRHERAYWSRVT